MSSSKTEKYSMIQKYDERLGTLCITFKPEYDEIETDNYKSILLFEEIKTSGLSFFPSIYNWNLPPKEKWKGIKFHKDIMVYDFYNNWDNFMKDIKGLDISDKYKSYSEYIEKKIKSHIREPTFKDYEKISNIPSNDDLYFCFIENPDIKIELIKSDICISIRSKLIRHRDFCNLFDFDKYNLQALMNKEQKLVTECRLTEECTNFSYSEDIVLV